MDEDWRQIRLLLWKDYLIRKRKIVALCGIVWATLVMFSIYSVRVNINTEDVPTCQYPARALPSAGMLNMMQSFICTLENDCSPMDQFQDIPSYENSKLAKLEKQFAPILYNETILEVAEVVPDALRLLATVSNLVEEPDLKTIAQNGLKIKDLFVNPFTIKKYLAKKFDLPKDVVADLLEGEISFSGITNLNINKCEATSLSNLVKVSKADTLVLFVEKICPLSNKDLEKIVFEILPEVNFRKYLRLIGTMLQKLNGDDWLISLAEMTSAVFRMMRLESFVPVELTPLLASAIGDLQDNKFTYFNLTILTSLMDLFEPTFGETEAYKSLRGLTDTLVSSVQWLYKLLQKHTKTENGTDTTVLEAMGLVFKNLGQKNGKLKTLPEMEKSFEVGFGQLKDIVENEGIKSSDVFNVLSKLTTVVMNLLPKSNQHEFLFYSTLLMKLVEGTHETVIKNINMEEIMYNVTKRHPDAVRILTLVPVKMVGNLFDALTDAERTEILSTRITNTNRLFCDVTKLRAFFRIDKTEADNLKTLLCTDQWKNYISDIVKAFGIFDVKNKINQMASLVITETLGKDNTNNMYSIEKDFKILDKFVQDLTKITNKQNKTKLNWSKLLNMDENANFFKVIKEKQGSYNKILITVHGAFAHEIVKQSPILEAKITGILIEGTYLMTSLNEALEAAPKDLITRFKKSYPVILQTMLRTLRDDKKTFKLLSTHSIDMVCNGVENGMKYFDFPENFNKEDILDMFCQLSNEIEETMNGKTKLAKAIQNLFDFKVNPVEDINWNKLISSMKNLYAILERDYPYLFEPTSYNMEKLVIGQINSELNALNSYWLNNVESVGRLMHLSIKVTFRALDLVDRDLFNITNDIWLKIKMAADSTNGLLVVSDQLVRLVTAVTLNNDSYEIKNLPLTVTALKKILPNIPQLIKDSVDVVIADDTNVQEVISVINSDPPWPCSQRSLSEVFAISQKSKSAIQGLEIVFCMGTDLQKEWLDYVEVQKIRNIATIKTATNLTIYEPHIFLKFSSNFDEVIQDLDEMRVVLEKAINNTTDTFNDTVSLINAVDYVAKVFNGTELEPFFGKLFSKVDQVMASIETENINNSTLISLWEAYLKCSNNTYIDGPCKAVSRSAWIYTMKYFAMTTTDVVGDLNTYFHEVNEPSANILQIMGFTKSTGLYLLYDKMADFMGVLLNSYWDQGFMNQIRRASKASFWDCDAIFDALVIPDGSRITPRDLKRVKPYVCPSILFWVSLPREENILLNLVAKPQNYFYTMPAKNLNSNFSTALKNILEFNKLLTYLSSKNFTMTDEETLTNKIEKTVDKLIHWKLEENDTSLILFNEINKKQFISSIYLTRITVIVSKITDVILALNSTTIPEGLNQNETKVFKQELTAIQRLFRRRPSEIISIHFDAITKMLFKNEKYDLINALRLFCMENKTEILMNEERVKTQFCGKNFTFHYEKIPSEFLDNDFEIAQKALEVFVQNLESVEDFMSINPVEFFGKRKELINLLQRSIKYAEDLGIPIYAKYLESNLRHYDVILTFLTGEDWWTAVKELYKGPYAMDFFETAEKSFDIVDDVVNHLDKFQIVKLLKDINLNNSDLFCTEGIKLSDYLPDSTGALSKVKNVLCMDDKTDLFKDLPPLVFASQGYEPQLKLPKTIDYTSINNTIVKIEIKLNLIANGPLSPMTPSWVTEEKVAKLKKTALSLMSKESFTKIAFGAVSNIVDGATLFLNNSQCKLCSSLTTWFKQINLQLIKSEEYDALLCRLHEMSSEDIYSALKNNFHWDMVIQELISARNYTNTELNKSLQEFVETIKSHVLSSQNSNSSKLLDCLANDFKRNEFGNITFFAKVTTKVLHLVRTMLPHIKDIPGIKEVPFLRELSKEVGPRLHVLVPLTKVLANNSELIVVLQEHLQYHEIDLKINNAVMDLYMVQNMSESNIDKWLILPNGSIKDICAKIHCKYIAQVIRMHINENEIKKKLKDLQMEQFWSFSFVSDVVYHIENILEHSSNILTVGTKIDIEGILQGKIASLIDFLLQIMQKDTSNIILKSLQGIITEFHPLLMDTPLDFDLQALNKGLEALIRFKDAIIEKSDIKVEPSKVIANEVAVELELSRLGINNTNFWSLAAPRISTGSIDLKPLLANNEKEIHISNYICQPAYMSRVIKPSDLDIVTADEVYGAILEQFCQLSDDMAKQVIPILLKNLNFTFILDNVLDKLLLEVYKASNLTNDQGTKVLSKYKDMMALIPTIQDNLGNVSGLLADDPMFAALKDFKSVKGLLTSSQFMDGAGQMLCGKPLINPNNNRFFKAIADMKDYKTNPDPLQLESLPSDFCQSLYKDIISMGGGKIIWSFIKPLLMGRILYTPETQQIKTIMEKANTTFAKMSQMRDLVYGFAESFSSIQTLSEHKESLTTMKQLMESQLFGDLAKTFMGGDSNPGSGVPDVDFSSLFEQFGDVKAMGSLVSKLASLLGCVNLNRFIPMPNEDKLTNEAVKLTRINEFAAGLVFLDNEDKSNVEYKIRMDIESVPTTSRKRNQFWTPGPEASFLENMRYFRGFIQIQDLVDKAIIQVVQNSSRRIEKRSTDALTELQEYGVYTQQMPYPCYKKDIFQSSLYESQALIVAFFFSLILSVSSVVRFIVWEKESGNTMLMSVMGLNVRNHTISWFIASFIEMILTNTCMFLALKLTGVVPNSDPLLLWLLMINFGFSVLTFCYLVSKFFKSASLGGVCTGILYLMSFMPYVIVLSMEAVLTTFQKIITSLSMSTAFCYSILYVARYEAIGEGAQWSNVWLSPSESDTMNIASASIIVLFDAFLYAVIGWLIDKVTGDKKTRDNLKNNSVPAEKAGVSIVNITKTYGGSSKSKLALDNVSVELHKGQITTLLGQNGAGKTTLIKIITGMLKPTKGHITIRTAQDSSNPKQVKLGVCPQSDVLIENMTSVEHLKFYAQLKSGLPLSDVEEEVQSMLYVLSMGGLAYEQVWRLSGGLRRRLCVALAFISRPGLVLLDEPSSGVDPVARRDIWSLIVKLKEDRTVLLTTHHLDEAELLSDQIVIMHKGQIHTTGSPIEIKRTLGNGYKLNVHYPKSFLKSSLTQDENVINDINNDEGKASIEENAKALLTKVRSVIKNAQVVDIEGLEVELILPFYDANGMNNDFLKLCTTIEENKEELHFTSYNLDCASLEQVFFNICQKAEHERPLSVDYSTTSSSTSSQESPTKSASTNSLKDDKTPLVPDNGRIQGTHLEQYKALLWKRWLHYSRNWWLLFITLVLPTVFVAIAMGFSLIRPPADNEVSLKLGPDLYKDSTEFLMRSPKTPQTEFTDDVLSILQNMYKTTNWTSKDNPVCECTTDSRQKCDYQDYPSQLPEMLLLPDTKTLLDWITSSHGRYIEKRYGGWTSSMSNNVSNLIAWYNNKGHHAMPSYVNALNSAILRTSSGKSITTYTHPLKISDEQLSKSTLLQHVADVGIAGVILIGFSLIPAGAAIYLVGERTSQEKRLQLLCGVTPVTYWAAAVTWDIIIILLNIVLTVCVLLAFNLPVFVERDNLAAICLLLFLFGFACNSVIHVMEKLFIDASLANMLLFCGNLFIGISGIAILLMLDIISESELTDNVRWTLHKIFLISPQFTLGDGLVEIAKNTVQAIVLKRFGMDTYNSPLTGGLISYHYTALILVGLFLTFLNLAMEYHWITALINRWRSPSNYNQESEMEDLEVATERYRVELATMRARSIARPTHLHTIGNIHAGFLPGDGKKSKLNESFTLESDVAQCLSLRKEYHSLSGTRVAVQNLTLGILPGQCTALLGENGAGKSTTFSMLTGETRPTAGQILLMEHPVTTTELCKGFISYCPQSDAIDRLLTVRQTLKFYCKLRGITAEDEVIRKTLDIFDIKKYSEQKTETLSGGNKRKLCAAIALMGRTPLVLLDEPTSGMDPGARTAVCRAVRRACASRRGVLLSTHALDDARQLATRIALLQRGTLRAVAPTQQCLLRFGGGYVVSVRVGAGQSTKIWSAVHAALPQAHLQTQHHCTLQFLVPTCTQRTKEEIVTLPSEIFRTMARLQSEYDVEDYTLNQSSLDQMFMSFSNRGELNQGYEAPSSDTLHDNEELNSITSL